MSEVCVPLGAETCDSTHLGFSFASCQHRDPTLLAQYAVSLLLGFVVLELLGCAACLDTTWEWHAAYCLSIVSKQVVQGKIHHFILPRDAVPKALFVL